MNTKKFIENYKDAFGGSTELPLVFWYSDNAIAQTAKKGRCIFTHLNEVRKGEAVSLNIDNIICGGGSFYCGFSDMPSYVPEFVSIKERYKQSPELVEALLSKISVPRISKSYLNIARVDQLESFEEVEGVLFYATPDILSGLVTWATFDNNHSDAVVSLFGSGCAQVITYTTQENNKGGYRCFLGLFDPSARPYLESNIMSFSIPMSRFKVMYQTMRQSCLFDTPAWSKIRERIIHES